MIANALAGRPFEMGLAKTVQWYLSNQEWVEEWGEANCARRA
jgi:dTDP-D-glucose 4,6-dehydratase